MSDYSLLFPSAPPILFPRLQRLVLGVIADIPAVPKLAARFISQCESLLEVQMIAEPSTVELLRFFLPPSATSQIREDESPEESFSFPPCLRTLCLKQPFPTGATFSFPSDDSLGTESDDGHSSNNNNRQMLSELAAVLGGFLTDKKGGSSLCLEWVQSSPEGEGFPTAMLDLRERINEERVVLIMI
jgi:hypothetical protein